MMYQLRRPHVQTNAIEAAKYLALIRKLYPRNRSLIGIGTTELVLTLPTAFPPPLHSSKSLYSFIITTALFIVSTPTLYYTIYISREQSIQHLYRKTTPLIIKQ